LFNILFVTHQLGFNMYGGSETQILKTLEYINNAPNTQYRVKLFNMWEDNLEKYDIIHIFNPRHFPIEAYHLCRYAKNIGINIVVSPVFYSHSMKKGKFLQSWVEDTFIKSRKFCSEIKIISNLDPLKKMNSVLKFSDILLPNTQEELNLLTKHFSISNKKSYIVPNGVDIEFKQGNSVFFKENYGVDDFILFVGRIEPRKNVLRLIKSFVKSGLDTKLVLIGSKVDFNYYELCKKYSTDKVIFLSPLPHDSSLLKSAYKAAKVVVLPSDYETPGLVALEGALAGANIVITKIGGTTEYFGEYARYVDPSSESDICQALIEMYNTPKSNELSMYIENNFTWNKVAEKTIHAYDTVTSSSRHK